MEELNMEGTSCFLNLSFYIDLAGLELGVKTN